MASPLGPPRSLYPGDAISSILFCLSFFERMRGGSIITSSRRDSRVAQLYPVTIPLPPICALASPALNTGSVLRVFRVLSACVRKSRILNSGALMAFSGTNIDVGPKAELTCIFASRGWGVIRVLSIVLERIKLHCVQLGTACCKRAFHTHAERHFSKNFTRTAINSRCCICAQMRICVPFNHNAACVKLEIYGASV